MINNPRPKCSIIIVIEGAQPVRINSSKTRAELNAILKDDVIELKSVDKTGVVNGQTKELDYLLVDEIFTIERSKIIFYTISESADPPKINTEHTGLVDPAGRKLN